MSVNNDLDEKLHNVNFRGTKFINIKEQNGKKAALKVNNTTIDLPTSLRREAAACWVSGGLE